MKRWRLRVTMLSSLNPHEPLINAAAEDRVEILQRVCRQADAGEYPGLGGAGQDLRVAGSVRQVSHIYFLG
jgi:hypothetical protein